MPKNYSETKKARHQVGGKCMNCTKPPRPDKMYCQECSDKKAQKDRERYKKRKLERLNYQAQRLTGPSEHSDNNVPGTKETHHENLQKQEKPRHLGKDLGVDMGPSGETVSVIV